MDLTIARDGGVAWAGTATTATLHRKIDELSAWLFRENEFPAGVILSTGTSLVPELPFTLRAGDEVRITISGIDGALINPVVRGKSALQAGVASSRAR
jgi:2-dehydro-3-deoxy-D-arabinonate dehydratase